MNETIRVRKAKLVFEKPEAHESRWGFHPCCYETYLKLKFLNKFYVKGLHQIAAWRRWDRKMPHNRLTYKHIRNENGQKIGKEVVGPRKEPVPNNPLIEKKHFTARYSWQKDYDYYGFKNRCDKIASDYKRARTPLPKDEVKPLTLDIETINKLYLEAKEGI